MQTKCIESVKGQKMNQFFFQKKLKRTDVFFFFCVMERETELIVRFEGTCRTLHRVFRKPEQQLVEQQHVYPVAAPRGDIFSPATLPAEHSV